MNVIKNATELCTYKWLNVKYNGMCFLHPPPHTQEVREGRERVDILEEMTFR